MMERDQLYENVHPLNDKLEMVYSLVDENEAIAMEARQESESSKLFAEQKEEEVKILEHSIEELESTINVLEKKVYEMDEEILKLLLHRMVPNARYSIWLDGKLELVVDPYQILERFRFVFKLCSIPKDSSSNFRLIFIFKLQDEDGVSVEGRRLRRLLCCNLASLMMENMSLKKEKDCARLRTHETR
ncbi:putative hexosyltransferase MUCI70 [Trifolium repens]|nr:putative hexosyltransferase MUCI70 [Trifolium repens]